MPTAARADIGRTLVQGALRTARLPVVLFGFIFLFRASLFAAQAAATPPGTTIVNVAGIETSSGPGGPVRGQSNPAVTIVSSTPLAALSKRVEPAGAVRPGDALRYTLEFENASALPLTGVVLTDPLDPYVAAVTELTTGWIPDRGPGSRRVLVTGLHDAAARAVRWTIASLPAGFRGEVSFKATLASSIPDETLVRNAFLAASDLDPNGVLSPEVTTPVVSPSLVLTLETSRDRVEVGDPVGFTLRVANVSASLDLSATTIRLILPQGFRYREGSLRVDGARAPDPGRGGKGREMEIPVGDLLRGEAREALLVGVAAAGSREGEVRAVSRASASTPSGIRVDAGPVERRLRVVEGVLAAEAILAGRVFVDVDGDGVQSSSEPGVPGARLFLEDGTQVVTDVAGKYHVEGIRPGPHVLKLDPETAPEGLRPAALNHRSSGTAAVQFVDVGRSDLFKANFALGGEGEALAALRVEAGPSGAAPRSSREGTAAPASDSPDGAPVGGERETLPLVLVSVLFEPGSSVLRREAEGILEAYAQLLRESGASSGDVKVSGAGVAGEALMEERARTLERALSKALGGPAAGRPVPRPPEVASIVPASGPAGPGGAAVARTGLGDAGAADPPAAPGAASGSSEEILRALPPGLYVLSPRPGQIVDAERVDVEVAFPTDREMRLWAGGEEVPPDRVGVRMRTSRSGMSLHRFVGVPLAEGPNVLAVEISGPGGPPQRIEVVVERVGAPARIEVRGEGGVQPADGRTPGRALIEVRDRRGRPVSDGTFVTVDCSSGSILGVDADPRRDGFQVRTSGGIAPVRLSAAASAETRSVRASAGEARGEGEVRFGPYLRDWIVAGLGQAGWSPSGSPGSSAVLGPLDGAGSSARLALFAKGKVGEDSLLSVSYDTGRRRDEEALFRTQDPSRQFPIYGDASLQSFDLESQGKLALRLERDRTMLMYGDFRTGLTAAELARYDRALSGGLVHVEQPNVTVHAFGATTPQRSVRDAVRAEGSSGPYRLSRRPLVAYSENVVLEVRDRFHTERILSTASQDRFTDYDVDYQGGTILFRSPVPAQDERFNPITIVVTYETVDVAGSDVVAGGRIGYRPSARLEWGTTAIQEQRGNHAASLRGMDVTFRPWAGAAVTTEYARAADGARQAGALALRFTAPLGDRAGVTAYFRDVPSDYSNPSMSGVSEIGTRKEGMDLRANLPDGTRLLAETFRQEEAATGIERSSAGLGLERPSGPVTWDLGARSLGGTTETGGRDGSSGLLRAGLRAKVGPRFDASLHRQEIVAGETIAGYPTRTELGAGYRFNDQVRGFLRHEMDEGDLRDTQRSLLGVEGALGDRTTVESRYALEDALNGGRGYALLGVRTRFPISDLWSGDVRLERSETVVGSPAPDFTSFGAGAEYLPGRSKFTSRYEVRFGTLETRHLLTSSGAVKITQDLSLFARQRLNLSDPDAAENRVDADGLIGLAFRPAASDRWNWLGRIQATRGETLPGGGSSLAGAPGARGLLGVLELNLQPARRWHLLGRYAGRYARDAFGGFDVRTYTEVWETRCLADVGRRATAGVAARLLRQNATGTALAGYGVESGYMVAKDLWLVGGYNVAGFTDERFPDGEHRARGPFLTLRFKFDESLLRGLAGREGPREEAP